VKQTGAKLARIDVSVVGKEAQLAEQEARLLSWTGGVASILLICFIVVICCSVSKQKGGSLIR